jgi:hypothetical protein
MLSLYLIFITLFHQSVSSRLAEAEGTQTELEDSLRDTETNFEVIITLLMRFLFSLGL